MRIASFSLDGITSNLLNNVSYTVQYLDVPRSYNWLEEVHIFWPYVDNLILVSRKINSKFAFNQSSLFTQERGGIEGRGERG